MEPCTSIVVSLKLTTWVVSFPSSVDSNTFSLTLIFWCTSLEEQLIHSANVVWETFPGERQIHMHPISQNGNWPQNQVCFQLVEPMDFIGLFIYLYKYRTGVGYKSKVYSKIVAITKLQGSMKYSFWKLDTHSILHTYRHIYMLKGTISYWLNSSNPLRSSKTNTSFFNGIKHSEPYQVSETSWNNYEWFISSGWNASVSRYNSTLYRLLHFVFSMKHLWLKK